MSSESSRTPGRGVLDTAPEPGAISFRSVTKTYDRSARDGRWRQALPGLTTSPRRPTIALDDVDLSIGPGEAVGLIGPNGAGKSTALKLLASVIESNEGRVDIGGRIGSMIELGLGFHPELTGWENLAASAAMMNVPAGELDAVSDELVAFAQLERMMDQPLKHYSTGMTARLGFALATHVPVDVLLVDEVLAVGDQDFQSRCIDRIHDLHEAGTTLVYVSHEMWAVDSVCDRVVRLDTGRVVADGPARTVIQDYLVPRSAVPTASSGTKAAAEILSLRTERPSISPLEPITIRAEVEIRQTVADLRIETDLALATIAPDQPISRRRTTAPEQLRSPGRFTIVGSSDPVPTDSGHLAVTVRLIDGREQHAIAQATTDFVVENDHAGRRPQLAVNIEMNLVPAEPPNRSRPFTANFHETGTPVARLERATKAFGSSGRSAIARAAIPGPWGKAGLTEVTAVDDVDLVIRSGIATGLIGPNGAGKTTILRLLAGTMAPTRGNVTTEGRVISMLDLGLGFHPDQSGLDNIETAAAFLGLDRGEIAGRLADILDFAGIGDAVEAPVRQYSTGMRARLGLAVAVHAEPDILLIDEVLAVGDELFRTRAVDAVNARRASGAAVVFVSHDLHLVEEVCDRVVRIAHGRVVDDGPAADVVDRAGGPGWSGGTTQATAAVRLHELRVGRRRVATGAPLTLSGWVEVTEPSRSIRLELGYRARVDDEVQAMTPADVAARTMMTRIVEPVDGRLCTPGWYRYDAVIHGNVLVGHVDVLMVAVDADDGTAVAESWQGVTFGRPGPTEDDDTTPVTLPVDVRWEVEGVPA